MRKTLADRQYLDNPSFTAMHSLNLTIAEHSLIVGAVEAGDAVLAATAMANPLNRANKLYHQKHLVQV